jgi:hypothetical protein
LQDSKEAKSADEICTQFNLVKPNIEFLEADFQNLTNYKLFSQHVRPLISKENPRVPQGKVVQLVAALWREFLAASPHKETVTPTRKVREGTDVMYLIILMYCT